MNTNNTPQSELKASLGPVGKAFINHFANGIPLDQLNPNGEPKHPNTDLVPIIVTNENYLVDARLLHKKLEVAERFYQWFQRKVKEYGFTEGEDFFLITKISVIKTRGGDRRSKDYLLTLDMAKELAMVQNNEVGRQMRKFFIAKEKELRTAPAATGRRITAHQGYQNSSRKNTQLDYLDLRHLPYTYTSVNNHNIRTISIEGVVHYQVSTFCGALGHRDKNNLVVQKLNLVKPMTRMVWLFGMTSPAWFATHEGISLIKSSRGRYTIQQQTMFL